MIRLWTAWPLSGISLRPQALIIGSKASQKRTGNTGIEVVAVHRIPMPERYRHFWGHSQLTELEGTAADVKLLGVECSEALRQWIVQLIEAFTNGSYVDMSFTCVIGRKAQL